MVKTSTRIVGALALAGALMSNAPVSAAQPTPGLLGDLNAARTSVDIFVPVDCDAAITTGQTNTATVSVYIFQSVGRLLNIGTGSSTPVTCGSGPEADAAITVNAIPGLKFQPGPATILMKLTEQLFEELTPGVFTPVVGTTPTVTESGARINLRP